MAEQVPVEVKVCGERLKLRVDAHDAERLRQAAEYANDKFEAFQEQGLSASTQRLAAMVALDLANELVRAGGLPGEPAPPPPEDNEANRRIDDMIGQIDKTLE